MGDNLFRVFVTDHHITVEQVSYLCWRKEVCSIKLFGDEHLVRLSQRVVVVFVIAQLIVGELSNIDLDLVGSGRSSCLPQSKPTSDDVRGIGLELLAFVELA